MPLVELNPLTAEQEALVSRVRELLKDAKPGETVTLPPDLVQAMDDAARDATLARRRLQWLHSPASSDVDGWEWGIFRVKWENGSPANVQHTYSDFSDLDAAIQGSAIAGVAPVQAPSSGVYVECRECSECGHTGINDSSPANAHCGQCGWSGPEPKEDRCPECNAENVMGAACPKCSGRYALVAEATAGVAPCARISEDDLTELERMVSQPSRPACFFPVDADQLANAVLLMIREVRAARGVDSSRAAQFKERLDRFERGAQRFGELWERCQGKGWPDAESDEFTKIRDERLPALRAELEAIAGVAGTPGETFPPADADGPGS
jgi:hypothetical protein